jgi:pimeloyl-ACP methyl ester carboxylesterase
MLRAALLFGVALFAAPVMASTGDCGALEKLKLPAAKVTAAGVVTAATGFTAPGATTPVKLPFDVCTVAVTARPSRDSDIRIAVMIPQGDAWNGKFVQVGNGGFAGQIPYGTMMLALGRGYAVAGTDDGHTAADGRDASWALGHPEKIVDFGWRAVKTTTDISKQVVAAYGTAAKRNYFFGCSDGGREALMTAERHPADFDGIVAGAPAWNWTRMMGVAGKGVQASMLPGRALPPAKLPALQAAALKACGNGQSYIADPRACHFDPGVIACTGAETDACLTPGQLETVRALYAGRRDVVTGAMSPGLMPGAESGPHGWGAWGIAADAGDASQATGQGFPWNYFAYLVRQDPHFDLRTLTDADVVAGDKRWATTLNADSADLHAFKAHGGKLIGYHGWNDPAIPPGQSLDYFARVQKTVGDSADFYRLFLVPGMLHCGGGDAPTNVAWIAELDKWVETGTAPDAIVAKGADGGAQAIKREK